MGKKYNYSDREVKQWESILKNDAKEHFLTRWNYHGKRFGKKELLELFADGYEYLSYLGRGKDHFKESYDSRVILPLKDKMKIEFFKRKTYNTLMSVYGKFVHLKDYYGEALLNNIEIKSETVKDGTNQTKQETKKNTQGNLSEFGKNAMKTPEEREKMISNLKKRIKSLNGRNIGLHKKIKELEAQKSGFESASEEFKEKGAPCQEYEEKVKKLEGEIDTLSTQLSEQREELDGLKKELKIRTGN